MSQCSVKTDSHSTGLPSWLRGWRTCLQCRRPRFDPWVGKIPWRRKWQPTLVFLPGECHGQRSLVGDGPCDGKGSDTTELLTFSVFSHPAGSRLTSHASLSFHFREWVHPGDRGTFCIPQCSSSLTKLWSYFLCPGSAWLSPPPQCTQTHRSIMWLTVLLLPSLATAITLFTLSLMGTALGTPPPAQSNEFHFEGRDGLLLNIQIPATETEKTMAPHSSTLAWKIPWMEEPGGLQSMGPLRVGHDWATALSLLTFLHWRRQG